MAKITHLLLAAGGSKRMGKPKQLLQWGNTILIEHQINVLLQTEQNVVVILGAHADTILPAIQHYPVSIFTNSNWAEGMGNSISFGTIMVKNKFPDTQGVLISLLDQPLVTTSHFQQLINNFQPSKQMIIASRSSSGWQGVPVLFDACYVEELQALQKEEGAKKIINKECSNVTSVNADNLLTDMDTPEVYDKMIKKLFPEC